MEALTVCWIHLRLSKTNIKWFSRSKFKWETEKDDSNIDWWKKKIRNFSMKLVCFVSLPLILKWSNLFSFCFNLLLLVRRMMIFWASTVFFSCCMFKRLNVVYLCRFQRCYSFVCVIFFLLFKRITVSCSTGMYNTTKILCNNSISWVHIRQSVKVHCSWTRQSQLRGFCSDVPIESNERRKKKDPTKRKTI